MNPVVCTAQNDCHLAGTCDTATGNCSNPEKPDTTSCDDHDQCTSLDQCTDGVCAGSGNACGDECAPGVNPCDDNADCNDPSSAPGNVQCTCRNGYQGNGTVCTDINECQGNPCGASRGTCMQGPPGTYTCDCMDGFAVVNTATGPTCVCDLGGTWAFQIKSTVSWPSTTYLGFDVLEGLDGGDSISWGIRTQTYDASGKLNTVIRACGGIAPDICDHPNEPNFLKPGRAYNQYEPNSFYDNLQITSNEPEFTLPMPLPASAFTTPVAYALTGIDLDVKDGAWPASRQNIAGGTGQQTNGAKWVTYVSGQPRGVTTLIVPPGGVVDDNTGNDDPPVNFGTTSTECPRTVGGARYPYDYLPNPALGDPIVSVRSGGRLTSFLDGAFDANSCGRITGAVKGPDNGRPRYEGRFDSCTTTSGTCTDAAINALDNQEQTQTISSVTFVMEKVGASFTCEQARGHDYNP
jgi:hypothetical protein